MVRPPMAAALRSGSPVFQEQARRRSRSSSAPSSNAAAVIVSAISPYRDARDKARAMVEANGTFLEVFVDASVEECARRDVKGLYEKAFKGEIKEFTGVSDPYEAPEHPEIRIESEHEEPEQSAQRILAALEE